MSELKDKTAKGMGWSFADTFVGSGVTAAVSIVLARLLSTSEFGLVGMIAIFISIASSIMDSGFCGALTRKQNATVKDFNTVFYTNLVLSIVLYLILFFSAPAISVFFDIPQLKILVRVLSISVLLLSFSQVQKAVLLRKLDFKSQTIVSLTASVLSGVLGIWMAVKGYGVWSLVAQQLSRIGVSSLMLWIVSSWKPSLVFSVESFKDMFSFGSKLLVTALVNVIWNEIYSVIIGKIYNSSLVGLYSRADKFKNMVSSNVGIVVQKVGYPVLSGIQDEKERQVRVFRKILKTTALVTCTLTFGLFSCSEAMVVVLIGDKWLPSVPFLRILCLSGVFLSLMMVSINILNANGKSGMTLKLELIKTLLAAGPILLGIFVSIEALLWGVAGVSAVSYLLHAFYVSKVINYSVSSQLKDIFPFFIISALMAAIVWFVGMIPVPLWCVLLLQLFTGFLVTLFIYEFIYKNEEYSDIRGAVLKLLHRKQKHKAQGRKTL